MQFVTCTAPHHCSNNLQFDSRDNNDYMTGFLSQGRRQPLLVGGASPNNLCTNVCFSFCQYDTFDDFFMVYFVPMYVIAFASMILLMIFQWCIS